MHSFDASPKVSLEWCLRRSFSHNLSWGLSTHVLESEAILLGLLIFLLLICSYPVTLWLTCDFYDACLLSASIESTSFCTFLHSCHKTFRFAYYSYYNSWKRHTLISNCTIFLISVVLPFCPTSGIHLYKYFLSLVMISTRNPYITLCFQFPHSVINLLFFPHPFLYPSLNTSVFLEFS